MILRGVPVRVADADYPDFGSPHVLHGKPSGTVLVVSGPKAGANVPGYELVARWDPATATEPYRSYRQTLLLIPIEPVAVYRST